MLAITIDMDWAPEAVIEDTLDLLSQYDAPCTIFATNQSTVTQAALSDRVEVGLHPNYLPLLNGQGGCPDRLLDELLELYPLSKGIRTHGIVQSAPLMASWAKKGLRYESHQYFPFQVPIYKDFNDLYRLPIYWGDGREIYLPYALEASRMNYTPQEPCVLAFHFIHIFMNTISGDHYQSYKKNYHEPDVLIRDRYRGPKKGVRDFFIDLLQRCKREKIQLVTCSEIVSKHIKKAGDNVAHVWRNDPSV